MENSTVAHSFTNVTTKNNYYENKEVITTLIINYHEGVEKCFSKIL